MFDFLLGRKSKTIHEELKEGQQAELLSNDPAFQRAVRSVREGLHIKWATSPVGDLEGQNQLRLMVKLLDDLEANIKLEVDSGKMATKQIEQERAEAKRRKEAKERGIRR